MDWQYVFGMLINHLRKMIEEHKLALLVEDRHSFGFSPKMLNTKLVSMICPPVIIDSAPPNTRRMLFPNPMASKPGEYERLAARTIRRTPSRMMINPLPKPVSRLKYLNKLKNPGRLGKSPKLYANTLVIDANDNMLKPSIMTVPARMKL